MCACVARWPDFKGQCVHPYQHSVCISSIDWYHEMPDPSKGLLAQHDMLLHVFIFSYFRHPLLVCWRDIADLNRGWPSCTVFMHAADAYQMRNAIGRPFPETVVIAACQNFSHFPGLSLFPLHRRHIWWCACGCLIVRRWPVTFLPSLTNGWTWTSHRLFTCLPRKGKYQWSSPGVTITTDDSLAFHLTIASSAAQNTVQYRVFYFIFFLRHCACLKKNKIACSSDSLFGLLHFQIY